MLSATIALTIGSSAVAGTDQSILSESASLISRTPLTKHSTIEQPVYAHRLVVKFRDEVLAREIDGDLVSQSGVDLRGIQDQLHVLTTELEIGHAEDGVWFEQLIQLPNEVLAYVEGRAAVRSGVAQPDLAGMFIVHGSADHLEGIAQLLHASDLTEFVYYQQLYPDPPCDDIMPITPQYFPNQQGYQGPNPGVNMQAAWLLGDATGTDIALADCEYGYVAGHEDLCNITMEPGQTIHPDVISFGWDEHGTATLGEVVSLVNDYGCTGLAPDADASFFTEWSIEEGYRRVTAITNAIASVDAGDVVMLEMQTVQWGTNYGPAELDAAVWTVVRSATDAGIIVAGAAGNGTQNLDSSTYSTYRSWGDSGAIIVGAGSSNTSHNTLYYSTYGSRVNVQGWGENVFTLGYGSYAQHGGDKNQRYTHVFNGTSSATPIVAGSILALQSLAVEQLGRRLSPGEMRDLLIETGTPQGSGGHIGPLPNVRVAGDILVENRILLHLGDLVVGEQTEFRTHNGTPGSSQYLIYSLTGAGSTYVSALGITLELDSPKLADSGTADSNGSITWIHTIPPAAAGRTLWFQTAEQNRISNLVTRDVQ